MMWVLLPADHIHVHGGRKLRTALSFSGSQRPKWLPKSKKRCKQRDLRGGLGIREL